MLYMMANLHDLLMQPADLNKEVVENVKNVVFIRHREKVCTTLPCGYPPWAWLDCSVWLPVLLQSLVQSVATSCVEHSRE